jgi:hypothetical protein
MNITRLLSVLLIGSVMLVVTSFTSEARRPSQNTVVIVPPPEPIVEPISPN